jgi:hypothetical protein
VNTYAYVDSSPLDAVDPTGLIKCFYDPVNMDLTNCVFIGKSDSDRDLYDWRKTGLVVFLTRYVSKPQYGMGPSSPNRRLPPTQPPVGPNVQGNQYWEIQYGYDVSTLYRQNMLTVVEEWLCSGPNSCRPDDVIRKRTTTCFSDWVATATTRRSMPWRRAYLKNLP